MVLAGEIVSLAHFNRLIVVGCGYPVHQKNRTSLGKPEPLCLLGRAGNRFQAFMSAQHRHAEVALKERVEWPMVGFKALDVQSSKQSGWYPDLIEHRGRAVHAEEPPDEDRRLGGTKAQLAGDLCGGGNACTR